MEVISRCVFYMCSLSWQSHVVTMVRDNQGYYKVKVIRITYNIKSWDGWVGQGAKIRFWFERAWGSIPLFIIIFLKNISAGLPTFFTLFFIFTILLLWRCFLKILLLASQLSSSYSFKNISTGLPAFFTLCFKFTLLCYVWVQIPKLFFIMPWQVHMPHLWWIVQKIVDAGKTPSYTLSFWRQFGLTFYLFFVATFASNP